MPVVHNAMVSISENNRALVPRGCSSAVIKDMKRIAVYAGSFDPPTLGHLWMVRTGASLFDEVVVVVAYNPDKPGMFSLEARLDLWQQLCADVPGCVRICTLNRGFLAEYAQQLGACCLLRGIRNTADFEYEKGMARINASMVPQVPTVFLTPPPELENVSSSLIRGFLGQPGWERWVSPHVHPAVLSVLKRKFGTEG